MEVVERPMGETEKLKTGLPWIIKNVRDARVMGHLPRRAASNEGKQPKRKKDVAVNRYMELEI